MSKKNTKSFFIKGASRVSFITNELIKSFSCWFEVTPLPDDEWEIVVKSQEEILCKYMTIVERD